MMKNKKANFSKKKFSCFPRLFGSQKKGLLKIVEVVIAIMILASVLLIAYSQTTERADISDYVSDLQNRILEDIASTDVLRGPVLAEDNDSIIGFVDANMPANFDFEVRICDIGAFAGLCRMTQSVDKNVYVEERVISSNLTTYGPKKIRLFVWEVD